MARSGVTPARRPKAVDTPARRTRRRRASTSRAASPQPSRAPELCRDLTREKVSVCLRPYDRLFTSPEPAHAVVERSPQALRHLRVLDHPQVERVARKARAQIRTRSERATRSPHLPPWARLVPSGAPICPACRFARPSSRGRTCSAAARACLTRMGNRNCARAAATDGARTR